MEGREVSFLPKEAFFNMSEDKRGRIFESRRGVPQPHLPSEFLIPDRAARQRG